MLAPDDAITGGDIEVARARIDGRIGRIRDPRDRRYRDGRLAR